MKIALCLSGQPRSYEKAYEYVHKNLLANNDVDVFWHSWEVVDHETKEKLIELYKPKDTLYTKYFNEESLKRYHKIHDSRFPPANTIHMLYSVFRSILLKREYELRNNIIYDCVIKSRFDYALNVKFDFSNIEKGKIYVPNDLIRGHLKPNGIYCNDQFAMGDSCSMDLYGMTFLYLDRAFNDYSCPVSGEDLLSVNLQLNGLVRERMIYIDMNNPFPPGQYNITPHSLIRDDFSKWNNLR